MQQILLESAKKALSQVILAERCNQIVKHKSKSNTGIFGKNNPLNFRPLQILISLFFQSRQVATYFYHFITQFHSSSFKRLALKSMFTLLKAYKLKLAISWTILSLLSKWRIKFPNKIYSPRKILTYPICTPSDLYLVAY